VYWQEPPHGVPGHNRHLKRVPVAKTTLAESDWKKLTYGPPEPWTPHPLAKVLRSEV
jgi:hypothetical protein